MTRYSFYFEAGLATCRAAKAALAGSERFDYHIYTGLADSVKSHHSSETLNPVAYQLVSVTIHLLLSFFFSSNFSKLMIREPQGYFYKLPIPLLIPPKVPGKRKIIFPPSHRQPLVMPRDIITSRTGQKQNRSPEILRIAPSPSRGSVDDVLCENLILQVWEGERSDEITA